MRSSGLPKAGISIAFACLFLSTVWAEQDMQGWKLALPGWHYEFPRDHFSHSAFKTEWWYFTGNLRSPSTGEEFGYQLTFFRQGINPQLPEGIRSRFAVRDLPFAHFAVSRLETKEYRHAHRWSRGAFGEAGFSERNRIAWIEDWSLEQKKEGAFLLRASEDDFSIELNLRSKKNPVFHGDSGISQKAEGPGRASHYYSFTRLWTEGVLRWDDEEFLVEGWSWYDHEWASNQLTENQTGWDWFSLQFEDGTDLMLFQIRTAEGGIDPYSGGTWLDANGKKTAIGREDFTLLPGRIWRSPETGGQYPVIWKLEIPKLDLRIDIVARQDAQEFRQKPISYWEGAVRAKGSRADTRVSALGYLEMTGYAGRIVGMQAPGTPQQR